MIAGGCAEVQPLFMRRKNRGVYGPVNVIKDIKDAGTGEGCIMKKMLFIYNPNAGTGVLKPKLSDVLDIFRECNVCLRKLDQIISNHSVIYSCRNESGST